MFSPSWPDSRTFWHNKRVIITGGAGFLGSFVVDKLRQRGAAEIIVPRRRDYDLRDVGAIRRLLGEGRTTNDERRRTNDERRTTNDERRTTNGDHRNGDSKIENRQSKIDMVIHLAANVGGIGANRAHPAEFFYDNLMMGVQLMHECWQAGVEKFVALGTVCAYPKFAPIPFQESELWNGYPEETNAPYGLAKKMMLVQSQTYREQYGYNSIFLLPVNLYGPGDNFDPATSHVIPALIRKCVEAQAHGAREIVAWGDGSPTREFLYVADAAEGILLAAERYNDSQPVNLGSSYEISIKALTETIARVVGFTGDIIWDTSKPNGQPRRKLDTNRAYELFGFQSQVGFEDGLRHTVEAYKNSGTESVAALTERLEMGG